MMKEGRSNIAEQDTMKKKKCAKTKCLSIDALYFQSVNVDNDDHQQHR